KSDYASSGAGKLIASVLGSRDFASGREEPFTLQHALDLRTEYSKEPALDHLPPAVALEIQTLASRTLDLFDRTLTPGAVFQPINDVGYMLAWSGLERAYMKLSVPAVTGDRNVLDLANDYAASRSKLDACKQQLSSKRLDVWEIKGAFLTPKLLSLERSRKRLSGLLAERSGIEASKGEWSNLTTLQTFIGMKMAKLATNLDHGDLLGGDLLGKGKEKLEALVVDELEVPTESLRTLILPELERVCLAAPDANWTFETLGSELETGVRELPNNTIAQRVYNSKVREIGKRFVERYPNWKSLSDASAALGAATTPDALATTSVAHLVKIRTALANLDPNLMRDFVAGIEKLLLEHLTSLEANWSAVHGNPPEGVAPEIDKGVLDAMVAVKGTSIAPASPAVTESAKRLMDDYKRAIQEKMLDFWKSLPADGDATLEMVKRLAGHFALMKERFGKKDNDADDGLDAAWLEDVESTLIERLEAHERRAREYWKPTPLHGQPGVSLIDAASMVSRLLERKSLEERLSGVAEEVKLPPLDDQLMNPKSAVFSKLDRAEKALASLRKLRSPVSAKKVMDTEYVKGLVLQATGIVSNALQAQNGPELAKKIAAIEKGQIVTNNVPEDAGGFYARGLFETLKLRMVEQVRDSYKADLEKLLDEFSTTLEALYVTDFDPKKAVDDATVMGNLGLLLDRPGRFEKLLKNYSVSDSTLGLFPTDAAAIDAEPIWATQRFLTELQQFLLGEKGRHVQDATVKLLLRPLSKEPATIWDPKVDKDWKEAFYYPVSAVGDWKYLKAVSADMPENPLDWPMRADSTKRLRMRWNDSPREARDFEAGDVQFEIVGSLAPLLFAWSGALDEDDGAWRVEALLKGSKLKAPFKVRFPERPLPSRPERRE
ncbi:MAG TPA: hypothetical protein VM509_07385, partial [Planctomycetota bacterium]|nr:hypothetical protein [Planctomycetota bacterium]